MIPIESRKGNFKNLIEELLYYEMTNADLLLNHRTLTFEAENNILLVIHLDDTYIVKSHANSRKNQNKTQLILPHFYQASAVSQCIDEMMDALVVESEVMVRFEL